MSVGNKDTFDGDLHVSGDKGPAQALNRKTFVGLFAAVGALIWASV